MRSRSLVSFSIGLSASVIFSASAQANETKTYQYDALGRLVQIDTSGGPANNASSDYQYDSAGNRTNVTASDGVTGGGVTCSLQTYNASSSDEFSAYAQISPIGVCSIDVPLSYTVTKVSGTGNWIDNGFLGGDSVLRPSNSYKLVGIQPYAYSVPDGETLVLRIDWVASQGNATITPTSSTVTFFSSF